MARTTNAFSFTKIIAERRADLAAARASVSRLQDNAPAFRAALHVANMVANRAASLDFTRWANVNTLCYSDTAELCVNIEGYVDTLKQGVIVDLIDHAMACGFEAVGSKDYLNSWATQRSFKFTQTVAGVLIELCITANIKGDSETCRKVQTGTKLEEVAQYEIVCS